MPCSSTSPPPNATAIAAMAAMAAPALIEMVGKLEHESVHLRRQVAWFQRHIFGQKSERRLPLADPEQGALGGDFAGVPEVVPAPTTRVVGHERGAKSGRGQGGADESTLLVDETKVPVDTITVPNPEVAGLTPAQCDVIGEKISHRLAQRSGSYVVLKYVRADIKRRDTQVLSCPPASVGVLDGSRADISFLAGMQVSRAWLSQLMHHAVMLLEPIHDAQLDSIQTSRVLAMDETPIKAGPIGKMKAEYFWPVYGQQDEICFQYCLGRSARYVQKAGGLSLPQGAVLQTDGYAAYAQYARKIGLIHAQCWSHARRKIFDAKDIEPGPARQVLERISALFAVEAYIREHYLTGAAKQAYRILHAKPVVQRLFAWIDKQFEQQGFLPSSPFAGALAYLRERRAGLEVYRDDPAVTIDTNHLERALRVIPMRRKNWLFNWTELGAKHIGIMQSLIVTCRPHDIDAYNYLVDVLQRVAQHPASKVQNSPPVHGKFTSPAIRCNHIYTTSRNGAVTLLVERLRMPITPIVGGSLTRR